MDNKDEVIIALQEMIGELTTKIINMRVAAGLQIKELQAEVAKLKEPRETAAGQIL